MKNTETCFVKLFAIIVLLVLFDGKVLSQVANYSFEQTSINYSTFHLENSLENNINYGIFGYATEDKMASYATYGPGIPIGFPFSYGGISYDRFGVVNSGWIALGQSTYGDHGVDFGQLTFNPLNALGPEVGVLRSRISAFDAPIVPKFETSKIQYEVQGFIPERSLHIKWSNFQLSNLSTINFEIVLNEVDNSIEIIYGGCNFVDCDEYSCQIGLGGIVAEDFNNRKTALNWNNTSSGNNNTDYCKLISSSIEPSDGLVFRFKPQTCTSVATVETINKSATSVTLKWNHSTSNFNQYEIALDSNIDPPASGLTTFDSLKTYTPLIANHSYYFHIRRVCNLDTTSTWRTFAINTLCTAYSLPYKENFDNEMEENLPDCYSTINNIAASNTWKVSSQIAQSNPNSLYISYPFDFSVNDWVIFPPLSLKKDSTYIFKCNLKGGDEDKILFAHAKTPLKDSLIVLDTFYGTNNQFKEVFKRFTPQSNASYFFALHTSSAYVGIDDVEISEDKCDTVSNVQVIENNIGLVRFKWSHVTDSIEYCVVENENDLSNTTQILFADSLDLLSLQQSSSYYLKIRKRCSEGTSTWQTYYFETKSTYDECNTAAAFSVELSNYCNNTTFFSTKGASPSPFSVSSCGGIADDDVWVSFIALGHSQTFTIVNSCNVGGGGGSRLLTNQVCGPMIVEVYDAHCPGNLLFCDSIFQDEYNNFSINTFHKDSSYVIRIFSIVNGGKGQKFGLCISSPESPTNDLCLNSTTLIVNDLFASGSSNLGGCELSTSPVIGCNGGPFYDMWYNFVATDTSHLIFAGANFCGPMVLELFSGSCTSLIYIACDTVTVNGISKLYISGLTIGSTYHIRIYDKYHIGPNCNISVAIFSIPSNDECENATNISNVNGITFADNIIGNTIGASGSGSCNANIADDDVWYKFTATNSQHLLLIIPLDTIPSIEFPVIELFNGACNAVSLSCSDSGELFATNLIPGTLYYFRVYSKEDGIGRGIFKVGVTVPPANFKCTNAIQVAVNNGVTCNQTTSFSMVGAGLENSIWVKFIANSSSQIIFCDSSQHLTDMRLYSNCNSNPIAYKQALGFLSYKNFIPGQTYYLKITLYVNYFKKRYYQDTISICITKVAPNDECADAIAIPEDTELVVRTYTSLGASPSSSPISCSLSALNYDVWYKFIANKEYYRLEVLGLGGEYVELLDACNGNSIKCFTRGIGNNKTIGHISNLQIGHEYLIKIENRRNIAGPINDFVGDFTMSLLALPSNDLCDNAIEIPQSDFQSCGNSLNGTLVNATPTILENYPSLNHKNVWYKFTASKTQAIINIKPLTSGFDPAIKVWNATVFPYSDYCAYTLFIGGIVMRNPADRTHGNLQNEVMTLYNLIIGDTYYIEVYAGSESIQEGDFDICLSPVTGQMELYSADFSPYQIDTLVSSGEFHQAILVGRIHFSGYKNSESIKKISFQIEGNNFDNYLEKAYLYFEANIYEDFFDPTDNFLKFGSSGVSHLSPILFGKGIPKADGTLSFDSDFTIPSFSDQTNPTINVQDVFLVYDVKCGVTPNQRIHAICTEIILENNDQLIPSNKQSLGLLTSERKEYHTKQNGNWNDAQTWTCNTVPPNDYNLLPIQINHDIVLNAQVNTGDIIINYSKSLSLLPNSMLEIGRSSQGNLTGFSNKYFDVKEGSFYMNKAKLIVNGAMYFGNQGAGDHQGDGITNGGYKLKQGSNTIFTDSNFESYASHDFCVNGGIVSIDGVQLPNKEKEIQEYRLFNTKDIQETNSREKKIRIRQKLRINDDVEKMIRAKKENFIALNFPDENRNEIILELNLLPQNDDQKVFSMPDRKEIKLHPSLHYQGKIKGQINSIATLSIFEDEVVAFISNNGTNVSLVKKGNEYEMYDFIADEALNFNCNVDDIGQKYSESEISKRSPSSAVFSKCVKVQLEVENDIVVDKGGVAQTINYVSSLFNQVSALYAQDSIKITWNEIDIWPSPSPYTGNTIDAVLKKFSDSKSNFSGDVAVFLSYKFNAGKAFIDGLCNQNRKRSCAYAGINSSYLNLPNYSWPTFVISHEIGHVLGSRHTHACVWNGDGSAIDGCYKNEGNCYSSNRPTDGGTIMSYCHLQDEGINFSKGFGIQPKNVIHNKILDATCLSSCGICNQNAFVLEIETDNHPYDNYWRLQNFQNQIISRGGPTLLPNDTEFYHICVPDGCYKLSVFDSKNNYSSGVMDIKNSTLEFDGNDGTVAGSTEGPLCLINASQFHFEKIHIKIKDPQRGASPSFVFGPHDDGNYYLNGKITTGGGDDSSSLYHFGYGIGNISYDFLFRQIRNLFIDTLHVKGGLYTENRHTHSVGNCNWIGNLIVDENKEYAGRLAIDRNIVNNGFITIGTSEDAFISFGKKVTLASHFKNDDARQSISGTGFFRRKFTDPYPTNQNQNSIQKMICNNSKGIDINLPLNVYDELVIRRGLLKTSTANLLSLGSETHQGRLFADSINELVFFSDDTIKHVNDWNGGRIQGPFKLYFNSGNTKAEHSILPLGDSLSNHPIAFKFQNTNAGYLIGNYKNLNPGNNGMPLYNEQASTIMAASPSGYWHIDSSGVSGNYDVNINALNFKDIDGADISDISKSRVVKRHGLDWKTSTSTTTIGPSNLNNVMAQHFTNFSDFGLGIGQDTNACGLWVFKSADGVNGSLRYVLNNCAQNGNTIKIVASIDTVFLSMDSILIDKNINISGTKVVNPTVVKGKIDKKVFEIQNARIVTISDMKIFSNSTQSIPSLKNNGTLTLNNIVITDEHGTGKLVNKAILKIEGIVKLE